MVFATGVGVGGRTLAGLQLQRKVVAAVWKQAGWVWEWRWFEEAVFSREAGQVHPPTQASSSTVVVAVCQQARSEMQVVVAGGVGLLSRPAQC